MKKYLTPLRVSVLSCAFAAVLQFQAQAEQVYYFGFENSLANDGSQLGSATIAGGTPTASTAKGTPTGLGSTSTEYFATGAKLTLPNSTNVLRLDTAGQNMTVSLWMYVDVASVSSVAWTDFMTTRGSAATGDAGTGWTLSLSGNNDATRDKLRINYPSGQKYGNNTLPLQQWVNVVFEMSSTNYNGGWKTYLNGVDDMTGWGVAVATNLQPILLQSGGNPIYYDDVSIWNSFLSVGKTRALSTAPTALALENAYNAGAMDDLFNLYDAGAGSLTVNSLTWNYATGFDTTGHALGDTWTAGGTNYIWLGGAANSATGVATVPEPATWAMLSGGALLLLFQGLRRRTAQLS